MAGYKYGVSASQLGGTAAYWIPQIDDAVASDDPNSLLVGAIASEFTQDANGRFTAEIASGAAGSGDDPNGCAYYIIPMQDILGSTIELDELDNFQIYYNMVSGMTQDSKVAVYAALLNGPAITDTRLWGRVDAFASFANIYRPRVGKNATPAAGPGASGSLRARLDGHTRMDGSTANRVHIVDLMIDGLDVNNLHLTNVDNQINGVGTSMTKAPHILIGVAAQTTVAAISLVFDIHVVAVKRPGGALPGTWV